MDTPKIFDSELKLCEILWQHQPDQVEADEVNFLPLAKAYSIPKDDPNRAAVLEDATVTALVGREDVQRAESRAFVQRNFSGSLPGFLNAFVGGKGLTAAEADELRRMIDQFEEEHHG